MYFLASLALHEHMKTNKECPFLLDTIGFEH
jgi:hypothetical protein